MTALPRHSPKPSGPASLSSVVAPLGYLATDLSAFVEVIDGNAQGNLGQIETLRAVAGDFSGAITSLNDGFVELGASARDTEEAAAARLETISDNGRRYEALSAWGAGIAPRTETLEAVLQEIMASNAQIARIARQVNILAVNASIEAARAGDAGRGFAVVAEAVNDLSRQTSTAVEGIRTAITSLDDWTRSMREDSSRMAPEFEKGLQAARETRETVGTIAEDMSAARGRIDAMTSTVAALSRAERDVVTICDSIETGTRQTAQGVAEARTRSGHMMDRFEMLVQRVAQMEPDGPDARMIAFAMDTAARISTAFEAGLRAGKIETDALFDTRHAPIPGTDPAQHMARHVRFTDEIVPGIIEPALQFDERIVFICPCDRTGYIGTHNKRFSHSQGADPAVNAAQSRNRRIFDDRVGKQAGANREPFLMQVYRRDMGAEGMVMMKDISAPVMVNGRHWGALRMGYRNLDGA